MGRFVRVVAMFGGSTLVSRQLDRGRDRVSVARAPVVSLLSKGVCMVFPLYVFLARFIAVVALNPFHWFSSGVVAGI